MIDRKRYYSFFSFFFFFFTPPTIKLCISLATTPYDFDDVCITLCLTHSTRLTGARLAQALHLFLYISLSVYRYHRRIDGYTRRIVLPPFDRKCNQRKFFTHPDKLITLSLSEFVIKLITTR